MNSSNLISIISANFVKKDPFCCNKSLDEICPYSAEAWAGKRFLGMLPSRTKSWFCDSFSLRIADGLLGRQPRSGGAQATPDTRTSLAMLLPYEQSIILWWLGHWHWKYKWEQVWNISIYVERGLSLGHGDQTRTHIYPCLTVMERGCDLVLLCVGLCWRQVWNANALASVCVLIRGAFLFNSATWRICNDSSFERFPPQKWHAIYS